MTFRKSGWLLGTVCACLLWPGGQDPLPAFLGLGNSVVLELQIKCFSAQILC